MDKAGQLPSRFNSLRATDWNLQTKDYHDSMKCCRKCGEKKEIEQFPFFASSTGGRKNTCTTCCKELSVLRKKLKDENIEFLKPFQKGDETDSPYILTIIIPDISSDIILRHLEMESQGAFIILNLLYLNGIG